MKYDFKDQTQTIKYELSDGEFATEPIFVGDGGENEDDGYVLVQTINTRAKKASIVILNAKDMKPEFIGLAPELGLFGLHSSFYPFDIGCSTDDCTPQPYTTTTTTTTTTTSTTTTTTTTTTHSADSSANSLLTTHAFIIFLLVGALNKISK